MLCNIVTLITIINNIYIGKKTSKLLYPTKNSEINFLQHKNLQQKSNSMKLQELGIMCIENKNHRPQTHLNPPLTRQIKPNEKKKKVSINIKFMEFQFR